MSTKIFVNLPVKNLNKSMDFFKALGWTFNPQFTDDTAACLVISDDIYAMLLTHKKFGEFTNKTIADGACSQCGVQPKLAGVMLDSVGGRMVSMFECDCGKQSWSYEPKQARSVGH